MVKFYSKKQTTVRMGEGKYFNKISSFIEKIGKQNFILILFVLLILGITGLYQTFSLFTSSEGVSMLDGIKTLKFVLGSDNTENSVTVAANSSKNIAITVSNHDKISLKYGVYYVSTDDLTNVDLGYIPSSDYPSSGLVEANSNYIITIKVYNNSLNDVTISFGIAYGLENGGDLILESNQKLLNIVYPYEFEVEYLESTGTQYIDTTVAPYNENIKVEVQYQYVEKNIEKITNDAIMGSRKITAETRFYPSSLSGYPHDRHVYGTETGSWEGGTITTTNDFQKHTILFNDESHDCYLDGILIGNLGTNFTPHDQNMYMFALNTEGKLDYQSSSKVYYCKIWDNGTLVRDYIPVIDRNGEPCLYDKVNDELYYNQNASSGDFYTNLVSPEIKVNRNTEITESNLRTINAIPENMPISNIKIYDSTNTQIGQTLSSYDVYKVIFQLNERKVEQTMITKPSTSITLTNSLDNAGFESELANYYNGTPSRSTDIKRSGNYSMYFNCSISQAFLRLKYGNIGAKDHSVYVRVHAMTDNTSLNPLVYVYETETNEDWSSVNERTVGYFNLTNPSVLYNNWQMISWVTSPTSSNYSYFMLQLAQANTAGTGNVYWDDLLAIVFDSNWDSIPTAVWMDKMIPDFTGTQAFSW